MKKIIVNITDDLTKVPNLEALLPQEFARATKLQEQGVLENLFAYSARQMNRRYRLLITFINHINARSFAAHTQKVGMDVIKSFTFNGNNYYELGYDTSRALTDKTTVNPS